VSRAESSQSVTICRRWEDDQVWMDRLRRDARSALLYQTDELKSVTTEVLARARAAGALSFALTGSTALNRRTRISDLDFYVVGRRPRLPFSDEEIDLHAVAEDEFRRRLDTGDDYLHWTLRFGLILYDCGPLRSALVRVGRESLWPDPRLKGVQAWRATELAVAILRTGDLDAAVEQCRVAFSLAARWWLLSCGIFPRARSDLSQQLRDTRLEWLSEHLEATILERPDETALFPAVERLRATLDGALRPSRRAYPVMPLG
jgi:hypothetical protein